MNILQQYETEDKSTWGDGPWKDEPDKVVWIDEATDLDCMIRRGPLGNWCGYVGLPPGHPWHGSSYYTEGDSPINNVEVHGGLTFANACEEDGDPATAICHVPQPGRPADVWWLGFDCGHGFDVIPGMLAREREMGLPPMRESHSVYRDMPYVVSEVEALALQCKEHE